MEWWSYGLSDFLMFSPAVYARLVERLNQELWPAQLPGLAAGGLVFVAAMRPRRPLRLACLLLAAAWAATGWQFHWQRYAEIFLAAPVVAVACGLQALLLAAAMLLPAPPPRPPSPLRDRAGLALLVAGWLVVPLVTAAVGGWWRAEVFGLLPDPTALVTLGWLLASRTLPGWAAGTLAAVPLASLLLGLLTRIALAQ